MTERTHVVLWTYIETSHGPVRMCVERSYAIPWFTGLFLLKSHFKSVYLTEYKHKRCVKPAINGWQLFKTDEGDDNVVIERPIYHSLLLCIRYYTLGKHE